MNSRILIIGTGNAAANIKKLVEMAFNEMPKESIPQLVIIEIPNLEPKHIVDKINLELLLRMPADEFNGKILDDIRPKNNRNKSQRTLQMKKMLNKTKEVLKLCKNKFGNQLTNTFKYKFKK